MAFSGTPSHRVKEREKDRRSACWRLSTRWSSVGNERPRGRLRCRMLRDRRSGPWRHGLHHRLSHKTSRGVFPLVGSGPHVRTRMWTLVGARMHAFGSRGLGVSTFPWGHVTDTRERMSHHLSFYDPKVEGG
ncbi:hypothetical protein CRG98_027715 [Punica granatum]|uniref:Uncharacterized protein n=1 Tax=Punica granatum TaxID=22663 RepID=A0A2I0J6P0_PUNGR|nr:hypothetical protein CRG98_027715 [Punica granatum]